MKQIYCETNKMHFDKENVLGAKMTTEWGEIMEEERNAKEPTLFEEMILNKTNALNREFCIGLLDVFGLEKTNELLSAEPLVHEFYLNDDGNCTGRFADKLVEHIIANSTEEEARSVSFIHETCKATFLWEICEMFEDHIS